MLLDTFKTHPVLLGIVSMRMNVLAAIRLAVQTLPATILSVPLLALAIQAIMAMEVYANLVLPATNVQVV